MGLGREAFSLYVHLYEKGFFREINSVIELGSQETKALLEDDILQFLKALGSKMPRQDFIKAQRTRGKRPLSKRLIRPFNLPARVIYQWLGVKEYYSIDSNGDSGAYIFNLNEDLKKKYNYSKTFDLVTNHGTTEHVFNQYTCFKNIHELTKNGGYMLHGLPFQGYVGHCFYNYQPNFYLDLALANKYELCEMWVVVDKNLLLPYSRRIVEYYRRHFATDMIIFCLLKKKSNKSFQMPFQRKYIEVTQTGLVDNLKFRPPRKPLWRKVLSRIMKMKI